MTKYVYIVSGAGQALWVGPDGNFEALLPADKPSDYNAQTSLKAAKGEQFEQFVNNNYLCEIYKFDNKPPYKFLGVVK
jgi:hypothetical protein